jgi:hypothetical protein
MLASTYDPANVAQQVVGTTATQLLSNKSFKHATIKPASVGGSASLFLDNDNSQTWEFFNNNGGSFGVYDQANGKQPLTIDPNTATDTLKLTSAGASTKALAVNNTNGTLNVTATTDGGDFNIYHTTGSTKTLAIYGSGAGIAHLNLLDGDLQTGTTTRLSNAGVLSNTSFDTATTGNTFKIAGTTVSSVTGSGAVNVLATSPTLVTPTIGAATATTVNKVTITAPATSATLTLAQGSSLITAGAFSNTLTTTATTNATLPSGTVTLVGTAATQTLTNKTIDASQLINATVTAAKMQNGMIYRRQGGDVSNWSTVGTTGYDVSASAVRTQVGSAQGSSSTDTTVTFPVAYTQVPLMFGTCQTSASGTAYVSFVSVSATGFTARTFNGTARLAEVFSWQAVGV